MEEVALTRGKSSALTSVGFLAFMVASSIVLGLIPVVGVLVGAAMYFGSPFTWLIFSMGETSEITDSTVILGIYAPYPIVGAILGLLWPLKGTKRKRLIRQVFVRFIIFFLVLLGVGICVALYVVAHDS
jgi:glucan phosphoethanolaminetransferase (alkaline phosphatase superfamily)